MLVAGWGGKGMGHGQREVANLIVSADSSHNLIGPLILNYYSDIYGEIRNINM